MSFVSFPESPPPQSTNREKSPLDVLRSLSKDGAAAVLQVARRRLEDERRQHLNLRHVGMRVFIARTELAAQEVTEGVWKDRVLLAAIYRLLRERGETEGFSLAMFKARLLEARRERFVRLARCRRARALNPMLIEASTLRYGRIPYHFLEIWRPGSLLAAIADTMYALSLEAQVEVIAFAQKVREDESLRHDRPRLATLSPEDFAARVRHTVNAGEGAVLIAELYLVFEERGEATGLAFESFKGRLLAGHLAGRILLGEGAFTSPASEISYEGRTFSVVCPNGAPPPIPWGPPPPLLRIQRASAFVSEDGPSSSP